ncbi:hypothetical protein SS50377_20247 [Spironucleus salmonicida]|uniref:Uncharacterized protein n=1 Tax=Spironucleus salmonicida TaxID=348837 RepID=V6LNK2_9EUKA|nr:hypothetical protein SS50377_20247 [Spironucleus salmonicida]|eukprot:EST45301.1 Hypothetical protein SS50377_14878 [Spironucleus salmonicida]
MRTSMTSSATKIFALPFGQQCGRTMSQKTSYCWTDFYNTQRSTINQKGGYIGNSFVSKPKYNAPKRIPSKQPDIYTYYKGVQLQNDKKYAGTIMARERSDAFKTKRVTDCVEFLDISKSLSFVNPRPSSATLYTSDRSSFRGGGKLTASGVGW